MRTYGLEQTFFGKRLGQILIRPDHTASCTIKQAVLRGKHDDRRLMKARVFLDQGARLVSIEPRHHDIDKDHVGLMVGDLA
jgi:hypothetical protein